MDSLLDTPTGRGVAWEDTLNSAVGGLAGLVNAFKGNDGENRTVAPPVPAATRQNSNLVLWIVVGLAGLLGLGLILRR